MSGLAEILLGANFKVFGSDMKESAVTKALEEKGATVAIGQVAENITADIDFVVYTAAIHPDNPEFIKAKELSLPMLTRAELLGQVMANYKYSIGIAGTHGKTTTTSMMSNVLMKGGYDPTVSVGGMLDSIGGNIRVGNSDYFVTEACEYTNSYHSLKPFVSIILNVDADHLDFFKGIEDIVHSFGVYAKKTPADGAVIICGDSPYFEEVASESKARVIAFGLDESNDFYPRNITYNEAGCATFTVCKDDEELDSVTLNQPGIHNVTNALAVIAAADFLGISLSKVKHALSNSDNAKRRFQFKGVTENGVTIIDDYAHHPTEIAATLATARNVVKGKLVTAFQSHTYSRTYSLLDEFAEVLSGFDQVLLPDIYAAREADTGLVSSKDLADKINALGGNAVYLGTFEATKEFIEKNLQKNDMLITMGAGNVDTVGDDLLKK